jgi:hypothetical protein
MHGSFLFGNSHACILSPANTGISWFLIPALPRTNIFPQYKIVNACVPSSHCLWLPVAGSSFFWFVQWWVFSLFFFCFVFSDRNERQSSTPAQRRVGVTVCVPKMAVPVWCQRRHYAIQ